MPELDDGDEWAIEERRNVSLHVMMPRPPGIENPGQNLVKNPATQQDGGGSGADQEPASLPLPFQDDGSSEVEEECAVYPIGWSA